MTLNPAQQAVVDSKAEVRVVLAGPGSGKTRTLVEAVKNASGRVAIMTFTNAGANELRERLALPFASLGLQPWQQAIFEGRKIVHLGTLHSYCFKLIQKYGGWLGYIPGKVTILPDEERIPRLKQCREKLGAKSVSEEAIVARKDTGGHRVDQLIALIWMEYEFLLKRNNMVDYDGILRVGLELLGLPEVRTQTKLDYLFVDEYQDSANIDQMIYGEIPARNKMYVGDPDQSIFAFRGAFPGGMVAIATGLVPAELHKLELNYRSDTDICTVANTLIAHNKERIEKVIIPVSTELGSVSVFAHEDVGQELAYLAGSISECRRSGSTVAVLYRNNFEMIQCRDYLRGMGVPVALPKYDRRPADWERALLLIGLEIAPNEILIDRYLSLKFKPKEIARMKAESTANGGKFIEAARITVVEPLPEHLPAFLTVNGISESTVRLIRARVALLPPDATMTDLLHELHTYEEPKEVEDGIYVGTIHSAKGREWDVVFLPAFEQGIIPHVKIVPSEEAGNPTTFTEAGGAAIDKWRALNIEEERRLAFVAVTRARHELYVSHVEFRRGQYGRIGGAPSQFLKEMFL